MRRTLSLACVFASFTLTCALSLQNRQDYSYANARNVRLELGHDAALPFYQELLRKHPNDVTAATRIAASCNSPARHDAACPLDAAKITQLRQLLKESNYNHEHIKTLFGISNQNNLSLCAGPVYVTPASAGSVLKDKSSSSSLECLVSLFLLGLSVRVEVLHTRLVGGKDSVQLLQDLGLAFPCDIQPDFLVPYVHLFPMDVGAGSLILATDLHPRVLSTTTVGVKQDGTVMYIGPDSLALVRNLPPVSSHFKHILDLCTGSGVQALAALRRVDYKHDDTSSTTALCVDVNERALRFVKFNAALNGLEEKVDTLQADLIAETTSLMEKLRQAWSRNSSRESESQVFDLVLANPPFIPVPPENDVIQQRYGLFSSGGPDGEDILRAVVQLASQLLVVNGGLLGVVSEFMNPPTFDGDETLLKRLKEWWLDGPGGRGILLSNELAVDATLYSQRRADTPEEQDVWLRHLSELNVTHVSPGLLFMMTDESMPEMKLQHRLVPKTSEGSLWTPSNRNAVVFTEKAVQNIVTIQQ